MIVLKEIKLKNMLVFEDKGKLEQFQKDFLGQGEKLCGVKFGNLFWVILVKDDCY